MPRKKKIKEDPNKIYRYAGLELGQEVFVKRYPDDKLGYGKITHFHPNQPSDGEDYISFACEICGQFRLANIGNIIHKPTAAHRSKIKKSNKRR